MSRFYAPFLVAPNRVKRNLDAMDLSPEERPTLWQLSLGVMRMWDRMAFRSETVGLCETDPPRQTKRARLLQFRALRLPALLAFGSVSPWDLTGLLSSPKRLIRHILGTHHDKDQAIYDLEILSRYPGGIETLRAQVRDIIDGCSPYAELARDLVVYENYHEKLLEIIDDFVANGPPPSPNPDVSFAAYVKWCTNQPSSPRSTLAQWRAGSWNPVTQFRTTSIEETP